MLAYVRKFTYLGAAKNSNKGYLTYDKGVSKYLKSIFPTIEPTYILFPYHICNYSFLLYTIYYINYHRGFVLKIFFLHL